MCPRLSSLSCFRAFTLVEVLLVVTIIALLISLLLPSMEQARENSRRAVCASNLSSIQHGVSAYATANQGRIFIVRGRQVQNAFDPLGNNVHAARGWDSDIDWIDAMATVGLAGSTKEDVGGGYIHRKPAEFWNCPSRAFKSQWERGFPQLVIGYQYFGGIDRWTNPFAPGGLLARSPLSVRSRGDWTLAADAAMKIDGVWGGGRATAYAGLPAHRQSGVEYPAGGNQLAFDGSVQWVAFEKLIFIHTWGGFARTSYMYQKDLGGWVPPAGAYGTP